MSRISRDTVEEFWDGEILCESLQAAKKVRPGEFLEKICTFLGVSDSRMWAAPSGRLALQWILEKTRQPGKRIVLAGGLNCPVVADAVKNAGLLLEVLDLADITGRINWHFVAEQIQPCHQAVIIPHLYGVPSDFRPIIDVCHRLGTLIIEDCAHTLGGKIAGKQAGSLGHAAIFSFNYDKPLSLGWGGTLLVNDPELAKKISVPETEEPTIQWEHDQLQLFMHHMARRRGMIGKSVLYHLMNSTWNCLFTGRRYVMPKAGIGKLRAALGIWQLEHFSQILEKRNRYALQVAEQAKNYRSWFVGPEITPAWLKQRVMTIPSERNLYVAKALQKKGLRVGNFNWPKPLVGCAQSTPPAQASLAARFALDIPVHQNMNDCEIRCIIEELNGKAM